MSLERLFDQVHNLPNIPKVVQELIDNFNNPDVNADAISKKLQMDQVLSAKVLRLANSARYGAGRKVASIDAAVVMLGFDTLKTLVVASGVTGAFKDVPGLDKKAFWRDSFMVANICKLIGKHSALDPEVAFTAGMLHNIGDVLIAMAEPEKWRKVHELVKEGGNRTELEQNQFGVDYTQVGAELARRWKFPEEIQDALANQAHPEEAEPFSGLAAAIKIARYVNDAMAAGKSREEILENFPMDLANQIGLDVVTFFDKMVDMFNEEDDIDSLLS
ncbi:HDOD domain-containing protein [Hahella sp. SMD15-11]|uniref:HDOD domain-containing protein n=1 Tax=Thermohahella caldifontis TaxID=3142973 RepID=A0AB39UTA5_9GAMM